MTDADSAAEDADEKDRLASRRLSVALRMHSDLVAGQSVTNAAVIRGGGMVPYSDPEWLAETAIARADALLAQLERPWPSSEPRSPSPPGPT